MKLTVKQEKFLQEWILTGNKSEAYRKSYNCNNMKAKTIAERASRLSNEYKISARYGELSAASQKRNNTTVDAVDCMLKEAFELAKDAVTPSSMVSASMGLIKLHGLDAETQLKINSEGSSDDLSPKEYLRLLADMMPD